MPETTILGPDGCPFGHPGPKGLEGKRRRIPVLCLGRDPIPAGAVYAGRPGRLGNPYMIGIDGDRAEVIRKFGCDFRMKLLRDEKFREYVHSLKDAAALTCHCPKPLPCHADVIAAYIEALP